MQDFARKLACQDAMVLGVKGEILETAFSNFFWRLGSRLYIPSSKLPVLQGVALECVKLAACDLGMKVHEVSTSWLDLPSEAQCYVCNALRGIRSVTSVGERNFQRDLSFE